MLAAAIGTTAAASPTPAEIARMTPKGYRVLASANGVAGMPGRAFEIVALGRTDEAADKMPAAASARPLIIFEKRGGHFVQVGRNDRVVLKADDGGQCDPFLDGDRPIKMKGRFFTVENSVACGQHWTDFITFRLDDRLGFVFDNERTESWSLNPDTSADVDALVRDGRQRVRRDKPGRVTPFSAWKANS